MKWVGKAAVTRARIRRIKRTTAALVGTRTHPHPLTSSLTAARLVNDFLLAPPPIELRALRSERHLKSCWIICDSVVKKLVSFEKRVALMTSLSEAKDAAGSPTLGTSLTPGATRVMLLGSGELGKEVAIELMRLGVRWCSLVPALSTQPIMCEAHSKHRTACTPPTLERRPVPGWTLTRVIRHVDGAWPRTPSLTESF